MMSPPIAVVVPFTYLISFNTIDFLLLHIYSTTKNPSSKAPASKKAAGGKSVKSKPR